MTVAVLDAATRAAVAAAMTQEASRSAAAAPWAGGDVTVRCMAGAVIAEVCTYGPWEFDSLTPRGMALGALGPSTVNVSGATVTSYVLVAAGTPILSVPAADLVLASPVTQTGRRTHLNTLRITANSDLPLALTYLLTFAADDTGTVGVDAAGSIVNTGTGACAWSITPPSNITVAPSSGTLAAGATQALVITASAAATYNLTLVSAGATITNATQSIVVALAPPTTATLSGSATATATVAETYTCTLDAVADQTYTITPSASDSGVISPTTRTITAGNTVGTFTVTWPAAGAGRTVDFTVSPTLTRAGRPITVAVSAFVPTWASAAASGEWVTVPMAAQLSAVDPMADPLVNPNYPATPEWSENLLRQRALVDSWCGAAYDEDTDTMWLGIGGGHRDYAGNEVYKCNFRHATPSWVMVRKPSGAIGNLLSTDDGQEASGVYSDGRPRAIHSYNRWVYAPGLGPVLMALGPGSWGGGAGKTWAAIINEADGEHTFTSTEATYLPAIDSEGAGAAYDPVRNAIWLTARNSTLMGRYNIPASGPKHLGTYTTHGTAVAKYNTTSICYIPGHDVLLVGNCSYDRTLPTWYVFDPATNIWHTPTITGSVPGGLGIGMTQPRWVPSLGAACCWDNVSSTTLIAKLTPGPDPRTAWTITTLPVTGGVTPSAAVAAGTFNRFSYSPTMGGFIVFNSTSGPTYFYKI